MGAPKELTLEGLAELVAEQTKQLAEQDKKIVEQTEQLAEQDKKIEELYGLIGEGKVTAAASGKPEVATIPTENLKYKKKEYKWNVAAFYLPGDSTRYTAKEAAVTDELIEKILKVDGQKILQELV